MKTKSHWIEKTYEVGDVEIIRGVECVCTDIQALPGELDNSCDYCPAWRRHAGCLEERRSAQYLCNHALTPNAVWVDAKIYALMRLKGQV